MTTGIISLIISHNGDIVRAVIAAIGSLFMLSFSIDGHQRWLERLFYVALSAAVLVIMLAPTIWSVIAMTVAAILCVLMFAMSRLRPGRSSW
jgi:hypothetical protein